MKKKLGGEGLMGEYFSRGEGTILLSEMNKNSNKYINKWIYLVVFKVILI